MNLLSFPQELDSPGSDFEFRARTSVVALEDAGIAGVIRDQGPLNENLPPGLEVLDASFCLSAPDCNVEQDRFLDFYFAFVNLTGGGGDVLFTYVWWPCFPFVAQ